MENNIYTKSDGTKIPADKLIIFELVNGLIKNVGLCSQTEGEVNLIAQENVKVLRAEVLRRLDTRQPQ